MISNGTNYTNESFDNIGYINNIITNNNVRRYDIRNDTSDMAKSNNDNRLDISLFTTESNNVKLPVMIYRFKFTEEFMKELYNFSKIHQYDERKQFKEAWKIWSEENEDIINDEIERLTKLGYEGDINDKMFKSARYYFRKKSNEKKEPKVRRQYISVNRDLLEAMDRHILKNIYNNDYQPKTDFIMFCKENEKNLKEALTNIYEQGVNDIKLIEEKIKKTYKNRYFILTQNK